MPMSAPLLPPRYRVFLLRLWEERGQPPDSTAIWRLSLEDARTGERIGFPNIQALSDYLSASLGVALEIERYDPDAQTTE